MKGMGASQGRDILGGVREERQERKRRNDGTCRKASDLQMAPDDEVTTSLAKSPSALVPEDELLRDQTMTALESHRQPVR